jgi:phosphoenolpyruvate carboxylase
LLIGDSSRRGKRRYLTMRIPASVMERVHRRLTRMV